jgi:hypothetical protein
MQYRSLSTLETCQRELWITLPMVPPKGIAMLSCSMPPASSGMPELVRLMLRDRLIARALSDGLGEFEARTTIRSAFAHAPREAAAPATNIASSVTAPRRAAKPESPRAIGAKFSSEPLPLPSSWREDLCGCSMHALSPESSWQLHRPEKMPKAM